jgi:hypothetical protein
LTARLIKLNRNSLPDQFLQKALDTSHEGNFDS